MKKYYISSDIEGTNGICDWSETELGDGNHPQFATRMTREINAVCKGINEVESNCTVLVKDAHDSGRNIIHDLLPENVQLNRGWSRDPRIMMNIIDSSFEASIFTGYHSAAGKSGSPLAHTMNVTDINYMKINNVIASEFLFNYYISNYYGVPVIMVSGDEQLCEEVRKVNPNIVTVSSYVGYGGSVTSKHPKLTENELFEATKIAMSKIDSCKISMPENFEVELSFKKPKDAVKASFYPGVEMIDDTTCLYKATDFFEVMRMFLFV